MPIRMLKKVRTPVRLQQDFFFCCWGLDLGAMMTDSK